MHDAEVSTYLSIETFEKIITFLEKSTGFAADLIPLVCHLTIFVLSMYMYMYNLSLIYTLTRCTLSGR